MILRYHRNLLGDEGYLMFTLPARPSQLIWSKALVSTVWVVLTAVLGCVSLLIIMTPVLSADIGASAWSALWSALQTAVRDRTAEYGVSWFLIPLEALALGIAWILDFCMHIYACLSLGSLANRHRLAWAFVAYIAFSVVTQILAAIAVKVYSGLPIPTDFPIGLATVAQVHLMLIGMLVWMIVCIIVNFVISNYILSNKLNLQ